LSLDNLRSIFQEELKQRVEDFISDSSVNTQFTSVFQGDLNNNTEVYISNRPGNFDTKFNLSETPLIPLDELGKSQLKGKSWENLYNADHSPKDGVGYGYPNVNRDKLDIKNNEAGRFGFAGSARTSVISLVGKSLSAIGLGNFGGEFLQDVGQEPYIVSKIPTGTDFGINGRLTNLGSRDIPIARSAVDGIRLAKYLTSPDGLLFIAKQNLLAKNSKSIFVDRDGSLMQRRQRFQDAYNPLSTLVQAVGRLGGGPVGLLNKTEPNIEDIFITNEYGNSGEAALGGTVKHNINDTFTKGASRGNDNNITSDLFSQVSDFGNNLLSNLTGEATKVEKTYFGDRHTLMGFGVSDKELSDTLGRTQYKNKIEDAHPGDSTNGTIEGEENGMPFYFKDMRDGAFIFFRAYLEGISENISPSWSPSSYIGRSDNVYTYERAEREIQFTLKLVAQTKDELVKIYKKMDKLTSLCYPEYVDDGYGNRMKPPLTKLRMGELFGNSGNNELMGFLKSLAYSVDQTSPWETEVGNRVPRHVTVSIGYQVIHASVPNLETKFYGINY